MYATCMHCLSGLGRNDSIEALPVGRTIAFDPERGRVWVICPACARWNLMPLEERWEAVEEADARFARCRQRVQSGNVAVGILPDATRLVRIAHVAGPELAFWRYGMRLRGAGVADRMLGTLHRWFGGTLLSPGVFGRHRLIHTLEGPSGTVMVRRSDLDGAEFEVDASAGRFDVRLRSWRFRYAREPWATPSPELAGQLLDRILVSVNRDRSGPRMVEAAVHHLARHGTGLIGALADTSAADSRGILRIRYEGEGGWRGEWSGGAAGFLAVPRFRTLALEMARQEDLERRALEEDLDVLARRWREAEALASIADRL